MLEHARGMGMLFDYLVQRGPDIAAIAASAKLKFENTLMREFFSHVINGTVSFGPDGAADGTGLYWPPRSRDNAMKLAHGVSDFADYLVADGEHDELRLALALADVPRSGNGMMGLAFSASNGKKYGMLLHISAKISATKGAAPSVFGQGMKDLGAPDSIQFPRKYISPLIARGFRHARASEASFEAEENATARLTTILLTAYGPRQSEVLQLWVNDAQRVNGRMEVFLHHPEKAIVTTPGHADRTRATYLREECGMEPRTSHLAGKYRAGWKGVALNKQFWTLLYPLPIEGLQEFVTRELEDYIMRISPAIMRRRFALGLMDHPFLLVSSSSTDPVTGCRTIGDPYTLAAYRKAWFVALKRLRHEFSDDQLRVLKRLGTTPHGLRHHYGSLLRELGVKPEMIQRFLHHLSPFSQQTYTSPRSEEVNNILNDAMDRMHAVNQGGAFAIFNDVNAMLDQIRHAPNWTRQ